ncbi:hypothetical protein A7979_04085 [Rothia nasimurium]|uniref:non-specific serine/threonine protein kinase n=1 Tax=Rothia nasimurium TaxID=85336 RepID=A0A1Y1RNT9_9MICC|nr:serine/threonine-protein kinase [Rothia nasimurium]ORC16505.1 hypothetical protein A7979_04085 [Rothia nasimurium]
MAEAAAGMPLGASYVLVDLAGKGASGQVWTLEHSKKSEPLVAKILHPHLAQDSAIVEHFVRERSVLMGLQHNHIVRIHDLVVEGSTLALVMDYFGGGSLRNILNQQGTLQPSLALRLTAVILETLAYAHGQNVIHRDIKPDNILFTEKTSAPDEAMLRVTDFGISSIITADHARTTGIVGTPHYLPPELVKNGTSGPAGDVYSAGILLYELLAGRTPFAGEGTDFTIAYRHVTSEVPLLDLPQPMMDGVLALLDKNPERRPHPLDAAARLRSLADRYGSLGALPLAQEPEHFTESARAQTVVRGLNVETADAEPQVMEDPAPALGQSVGATVLKPRKALGDEDWGESAADRGEESSDKKKSKALWLGILGFVLLLGTGWAIYWAVTSSSAPRDPFTVAGKQEAPLPTGLSVRREATYDPRSSTIDLTVTYSAQKAPLSGDLLEVIPATSEGSTCPNATWERVDAERNQPSVTDMNVECGWRLQGVEVKSNQEFAVTTTIAAEVADEQQLEKWLDQVSSQTQEAVMSEDYSSVAYPAQRLTDIAVKVPERTVSQTAVPITLLPVWPSGEDALNPLFSSESTGRPSGMLQAVAGDENPVRFSDGCAGHLMVDSSGLKVTALSVSDRCTVNAQVGNFTDLRSENFVITTRD